MILDRPPLTVRAMPEGTEGVALDGGTKSPAWRSQDMEVTMSKHSLCSESSKPSDDSKRCSPQASPSQSRKSSHRESTVRFHDHLESLRDAFVKLEAQLATLEEENMRLSKQDGETFALSSPGTSPEAKARTSLSDEIVVYGESDVMDGDVGSSAPPAKRVTGGSGVSVYAAYTQSVGTSATIMVRDCFRLRPPGQDMSSTAALLFTSGHSQGSGGLSEAETCRVLKCQALDPSSPARLSLELMTVLVCIHDAILVPYSLAWDPPLSTEMRITSFCTLTFWFADMILNFFTGFYREGMLVTDLRMIAWRYITTFFFIDLVINGVDVVSIFMEVFLEANASSPSLRILRLFKLNRLLRVAVLFNRYKDKLRTSNVDSSSFTIVGLGMRLVAILFFLNHLICCGWYWIGANADFQDTEASWLDQKITSGGLTYREASVQMQYLTSLHWAFTQMTPGSMSVVPQNSFERAWNCFVLVIGLFVSALLISQLSAKMVRVQSLNHDRLYEMELLARFLSEQGVPRGLATRIRRQVRERALFSKPLTISDVPPLGLLPTTLRHELQCSIFSRTLLNHTVFFAWATVEESLVEDMSSRAVDLEAYSRHDDIFVPLQEAKKVYNLRVGSLTYHRVIFTQADQTWQRGHSQRGLNVLGHDLSDGGELDAEDSGEVSLGPKAWLSMMSLWCKWSYVGTCQAKENVEFVAIDVDSVIEVLGRYPSLFKLNRAYALAFSILATDPEHSSISDLDIVPAQVLMAMDIEDRVGLSTLVLESFSWNGNQSVIDQYVASKREKVKQPARDKLFQELELGRCVMTLGSDGQMLRTVLLSVLFITRENGDVLVEVATVKTGKLVLDCKLPGSKLGEKETFRTAAERVLATDLQMLGGTIDWDMPIDENSTSKSSSTSIRTAYLKKRFLLNYCSPEAEAEAQERESQLPGNRPGFAASHTRPLGMAKMKKSPSDHHANLNHLTILKGLCQDGKLQLYTWLPKHVFDEVHLYSEDLKVFMDSIAHELQVVEGLGEGSAEIGLTSAVCSQGPANGDDVSINLGTECRTWI